MLDAIIQPWLPGGSTSFYLLHKEEVWRGPVTSPVHLERKAALGHTPSSPMAAAEKLLRQRSPACWDRKETESGLPEAIAAPFTPPMTLSLLPGLGAGDLLRTGQGPKGLPTGRWLHWQEQGRLTACQAQFRPGLRNKGLSWGVTQAEGRRMVRCMRRQVHMEGKSEPNRPGWHGSLGSGPHSQGGRRSLAASEGPICAICQ